MNRRSFGIGLGFGLTSGVITTLGLLIGLYAAQSPVNIIIAGILVIAFSDALSDSLGIHVVVEIKEDSNTREVWEATIITFLAKLIIALSFLIPIISLPISTAVIVSIIWGIFLIGLFSLFIAKKNKKNFLNIFAEHSLIAFAVIIVTHYIGKLISTYLT